MAILGNAIRFLLSAAFSIHLVKALVQEHHLPRAIPNESSGNLILPPICSTDNEFITRRRAFERTAAIASTTLASSQLILPRAQAITEGAGPIVPTVRLGKSDLEISRTIQGHWQLAGGHGQFTESEVLKNMAAHYKQGITTLDTADIYGVSEYV